MASSDFTPNLGLCAWNANDCPKRADFVSDNAVIDSVLGAHVNNSAIHLTAEEKAKALTPFESFAYAGNGEASRTILTGYPPKLAIVYKKNAAPVEYGSSVTIVNFGVGSYGHGGTMGVALSTSGVVVSEQSTASNGKRVSLNESGSQYAAIVFK